MINLINHHYNYAKTENNYAPFLKEKGIHYISLSISRRVVRPLRAGCILNILSIHFEFSITFKTNCIQCFLLWTYLFRYLLQNYNIKLKLTNKVQHNYHPWQNVVFYICFPKKLNHAIRFVSYVLYSLKSLVYSDDLEYDDSGLFFFIWLYKKTKSCERFSS